MTTPTLRRRLLVLSDDTINWLWTWAEQHQVPPVRGRYYAETTLQAMRAALEAAERKP